MKGENFTKDQLMHKLIDLQQRINELEALKLEYKQIEEALVESEIKYKTLVDKSLVGICITQNCIVKFCNQKFVELFGFQNPEGMFGIHIHEFVAPESWELVDREVNLRESGKKESARYEFRGIKKDGTRIDIEVLGSRIVFRGKPAVQGMLIDITKRKRTEEALRDSEYKFRSLFDISPFPISVTEAKTGGIVDVNKKFCELTKYSKEDIIGRTAAELKIYPEEKRNNFIKELLELGEIHGLEMDFKIKDGSIINTFMFAKITKISNEDYLLSEFIDVTERKKLEAQLKHALKMEGIGTLAGGIAHDFNNILMGIQGNSSLMLLNIEQDHPHYEKLKSIEQLIQSGTDLTKQLLGFARGGKYEVRPTNLNELIDKTCTIFGRTKKEIKIFREFQKDIWLVEVDQGQIEQVLMNLYVNAWQAMTGNGSLYLETKNVVIDKNYIKPFKVKHGNYVKISVTDTGEGIDEVTQQKIFDPFFTTKEMGRGTGLGLASAYGIVKNHEGIINVYSNKGKGTTFNIYIPASDKKFKEEIEASKEILRGKEIILLVDDEATIIEVGEEILKTIGYKVLSAGSGKEALQLYRKNKDKIDMVILDMIMPEMNGDIVYDLLKKINSNIKVLLSSGYSKNGLASEILDQGCNGFIQKPFTIKDLSHKIREILDS